MIKKRFILISISCLSSANLLAQITTDGSLGPDMNLLEPDYQIGAELGQQHGRNLFHSFHEFNLQPWETATFSGPNNIQNVISRVTGRNPSHINGLIRSTGMPNADFYFLNPYGIIFGPNASLDVPGSFHASTADYLSLGNGGYFDARNLNNSLLTVAPVEAFGFLNYQPGAITIQGSSIKVLEQQAISIIGGDVFIEGGSLSAPSGRINLAAVASPGNVIPTLSDFLMKSFEKLGTIEISEYSDNPHLDVTDYDLKSTDTDNIGGGQIFIRAGKFILDSGWITADTYLNGDGLGIDIAIDGEMVLTNGALITVDNYGTAQGGNIKINTTGFFELSGETTILQAVLDSINEYPDVSKTILQIALLEDSLIRENQLNEFLTFLQENQPEIAEQITKTLDEYGVEIQNVSPIYSKVTANNLSTGIGGTITIETPVLDTNFSHIQAATKGGEAGSIQVDASQVLLDSSIISGGIGKNSLAQGKAGHININANTISLTNVSTIEAGSNSDTIGQAGYISLNTQHLILENNGFIHALSYGEGNAGQIDINTDTAKITEVSGITTEASQARGGNIFFNVRDYLEITHESRITAEALGSKSQDSGGNIIIGQPRLFTLINSYLRANAYGGNGGEINIETYNFTGENSEINVSSRFGLNGNFYFNRVLVRKNYLTPMQPISSLDELRNNRCLGFSKAELSQFLVIGRDALPQSPDNPKSYLPFIGE